MGSAKRERTEEGKMASMRESTAIVIDHIVEKLGISRREASRLVAQALTAYLILDEVEGQVRFLIDSNREGVGEEYAEKEAH